MKSKSFPIVLMLLFYSFLAACSSQPKYSRSEEAIARRAVDFAYLYYNQQFTEAVGLATPESRPWIAFAASALTADDLVVINAEGEASYAETDAVEQTSDTTATVQLTVSRVFVIDSIGQPGHFTDRQQVSLQLVRRANNWLVSLTHGL